MRALYYVARAKSMKSLATAVLVAAMGCGAAIAQDQRAGGPPRSGPGADVYFIGLSIAHDRRTGGPSPSSPGAEVYFIGLKDGATVPAKLKINFGLRNMTIAPAGSERENSGHHHLLIDTDLPPLDQPIPNDFNHLHFGRGQTEAEIMLKPG